MTEQEAIGAQYASIVQSLFATFHGSCVTAKTAAEEKKAEQKFVNAIKQARDARTRALAILPG